MSRKVKKTVPDGIRERLYRDWSTFQRLMFIENKTKKLRTAGLYMGVSVDLEGREYSLSQVYNYHKKALSGEENFSFTNFGSKIVRTFHVPGKVRKDGILNINLHVLQQKIDELSVEEMMEL